MHVLRHWRCESHNTISPFQNVSPCPTFNPLTHPPSPFSHQLRLRQELALGEVYAEFGCHGWVHSVAWSPSGSSMAFTGHDSSLHVVTFPAKGTAAYTGWEHVCVSCVGAGCALSIATYGALGIASRGFQIVFPHSSEG